MHVDLVDPIKLSEARHLLGTTSTRATLDLALELLLAQSDLIEAEVVSTIPVDPDPMPLDWE